MVIWQATNLLIQPYPCCLMTAILFQQIVSEISVYGKHFFTPSFEKLNLGKKPVDISKLTLDTYRLVKTNGTFRVKSSCFDWWCWRSFSFFRLWVWGWRFRTYYGTLTHHLQDKKITGEESREICLWNKILLLFSPD